MKSFVGTAIGGLFFLLLPSLAFASATVISVSLNGTVLGGSPIPANPGDNLVLSVTAQLSGSTKWKGTDWGIATTSAMPTCTNTKNAKDGTRDNPTGIFTETFIIKTPKAAGLYNLNIAPDGANNCGSPLTGVDTFLYAVRVGTNATPPVIAAHSDLSVPALDGRGASVVYTNPLGTDAFGNPIAVMCTPASGAYLLIGNNLIECTGADSWGNQATPSFFTASVFDVTAPVIATSANVFATTTGTSALVSYVLPTATDNADGTDPVSCNPLSGSSFALGTTTVTCTATDIAGNTATSTFAVIVAQTKPSDTTPPVISPHADVSTTTTSSVGTAVFYTLPIATDNIDGTDPVSCTPTSGSTFALGTTAVSCTATDHAGNTATSSFKVILTLVRDTTPPLIGQNADITVSVPLYEATTVNYSLPTASDPDGDAVAVSCLPASGASFDVGTTTVTCTATDTNGNSASSAFRVIVNGPVFIQSPLVDTLDTFNGWNTFLGGTNFTADDGTDGFCHLGGCINTNGVSDNTFPSVTKSGISEANGSLTIWGKYNKASFGFGGPMLEWCSGDPSLGICDYEINFAPSDNAWHKYFVAWRDNYINNDKEYCTLKDDTNQSDCAWQASGTFNLGDTINFIALTTSTAGRYSSGDAAWFDDLENGNN